MPHRGLGGRKGGRGERVEGATLVDHKSDVNQKRVKLKLGILRSFSFLAIMSERARLCRVPCGSEMAS